MLSANTRGNALSTFTLNAAMRRPKLNISAVKPMRLNTNVWKVAVSALNAPKNTVSVPMNALKDAVRSPANVWKDAKLSARDTNVWKAAMNVLNAPKNMRNQSTFVSNKNAAVVVKVEIIADANVVISVVALLLPLKIKPQLAHPLKLPLAHPLKPQLAHPLKPQLALPLKPRLALPLKPQLAHPLRPQLRIMIST